MKLFPNRAQLQEMKQKNEHLRARIEVYKEVQEFLTKNILTLQEIQSSYRGNEYKEYATAVQAISDKYTNKADWGCTQTGAIVDLRSAFILGDGLQISPATPTKAEADRELNWTKEFFTFNGLDAEMAQEIVKEAEIEGKAALNIMFDDKAYDDDPERAALLPAGMVSTRFVSWLNKKYIVTIDPADYLWYKELSWKEQTVKIGNESRHIPAGKLSESEFVYKKFGGRIYDANDAQPKVMKCLTQIDRLDRALWDLRKINHLFASPTPDFEVENAKDINELEEKLTKINWKIGKMLIHTGTFSFKTTDAAGVDNLLREIEMSIKIISGTTGIPIHYLGLLDLLKNRATGDNTRELVMAATSKERQIWIGAFTELVDKAMRLYNQKSGLAQKSAEKQLNSKRIKIHIPEISEEHWAHLEKVFIPAKLAGILSPETVAAQIPGIDMEEEAGRKKEREAKEEEQAAHELERLKAEAAQMGEAIQ